MKIRADLDGARALLYVRDRYGLRGGVGGVRPGLQQEAGDGQQASADVALGAVGVGQAIGELVDELLQGGDQFAVEGVVEGALDGGGVG